MTASAQGIDVSAYQAPLTAADLDGLDFAFAKATDGAGETDPHFDGNWRVIKAAGKFRGAYHELRAEPVAAQAAHFLAVVRAGGLEAGDMLAVSVSDYPGAAADAPGFLAAVKDATGGRNPVFCYTDLSVAEGLGSCAGYPLWIAWPSDTAPPSVAPWPEWKLWQWDETELDRDAFNGTAADLAAFIAGYAKPSPHPSPEYVEFDVSKLPVLKQGDFDKPGSFWFVHRLQLLVALAGKLNGLSAAAAVTDDGDFGPGTDRGLREVQAHYKITVDGIAGAQTWGVLLTGSPA